ncbi:hypothetical protein B0H14DRAFT_3786453 [Mycena olivaceomarginata]|nr:hypothetical protein B0H14DRAFT_3786453 [Mycena olivaceomarginata]
MVCRFSAGGALILSLVAARAFATLTNITVDDMNSTVWTFVGGWSAVTATTPCSTCFAQPDPQQVFNSSWHDGSVVSGLVTFQGSAIYIYGIDMTATSGTNISFSMNNPPTASFHYFGGTGSKYHVPFFSATNLDSNIGHTVSFIGQTSLTGAGAMLFDYAVITVDQPDTTSSSAFSTTTPSSTSPSPSSTPPSPPHKSKTSAIVGGVVGAVGLLAIAGAVVLFLRRRRRRAALAQPKIDIDGENYYDSPSRGISTGYTIDPYQLVPTNEPPEPSLVGGAVSSSRDSATSAPPVPTGSSPPAPASRSESKSTPAPVILGWDPEAARARELDLEERLRQLEALSRPPAYNSDE